MTYDDRNLKALATLDPVARDKFSQFLSALEKAGLDVLVTDAFRTAAEQDAEFAKVPPVTHVKGLDSFHCWGVAIDICPIGGFGGLNYKDEASYRTAARIAYTMDIKWGFQMWGFDEPHFQYDQGLTIADFKAGKRLAPPAPVFTAPTVAELQHRIGQLEQALAVASQPRKSGLLLLINSLKRGLTRL